MTGSSTSLRRQNPGDRATPALLVLSSVLLALGLVLPLMHLEKMLFWENSYSVVTGVFGLFEDRQYVLGAVVLFWSVVFPIAKLALLHWLWFARIPASRRARVVRWLDKLGKWSMLDVYIVAVLVVAVKLGPLAEVTVEQGLYVFGAAVFLTMAAGARVEKLAHPPRR